MQNRRLLDYDRETGLQTWHTFDDDTNTTIIEEVQDLRPFAERNHAIQNHEAGGALGLNEYSRKGIKESWWHVASIPVVTQLEWLRRYGVNIHHFSKCDWTQKKVKQLLNSREWAWLRTGTGRI